jgi:hypothetical protein
MTLKKHLKLNHQHLEHCLNKRIPLVKQEKPKVFLLKHRISLNNNRQELKMKMNSPQLRAHREPKSVEAVFSVD